MVIIPRLTLALLWAVLPIGVMACSDDSDGGGHAGANGEAGGGNTGTGGSGNGAAGSENGTAGDGSVADCDLSREGREKVVIDEDIDQDMSLDASNYYVIEGIVHVLDGATLTVPPCTRIEGDGSTLGTLVVSRGGRIVADGDADAPILFTSSNTAVAGVDAEPGDWGGLVILGRAPNAAGANVLIEGMADDALNQHGDVDPDPDDDSGVLRYVKIEYSGVDLGDGNEINGLSLGSVGAGTTISHVMVANTLDDCFEWFGGTVDADHLICENPGDDMFDTDDGYQGSLEYLFGRHGAALSGDPSGFEWDGSTDTDGSIDTIVNVRNATMCSGESAQFGMVLRRGIRGSIENAVVLGFPIGVDVRDEDFEDGSDHDGDVTIENSIIVAEALARDESGEDNNDAGFDDEAWFLEGEGNTTDEPDFDVGDCMDSDGPGSSVSGSGLGAFTDDTDWVYGVWTGWEL